MNKKRLIITSVISIILVSILMIGSTYAIFNESVEIDETANVYTTGNLAVTYTLSEDNVQLTDVEPLNIEDANTVIPYRITVTNTGNVPYQFSVYLDDTTASNVVDYKYIMTKVGYLESKPLSECANNIIKNDVIVSANSSVDIDVRVWLSDTIQNSEIGKSFFGKLKIDGKAVYDDNIIDNPKLSLKYMKGFTAYDDYSYFRSDTYREKIKNASFVNYIDTSNAVSGAIWDMTDTSKSPENSVVAWLENNTTSGYYDLYIGSNEVIFADDLGNFFYNLVVIDSIDFSNLDTSLTKNMQAMFSGTGENSTVFTLDLGEKFDTSNVTNMMGMFYYTGRNSTVFTLDLGEKFDTSNVTSMSVMFLQTGYSSTIFTLDLGEKFDTSNVTDMESMFNYTGYNSTVFTLDLGEKFDTSNVTSMGGMFLQTGCNSAAFTLDLGEKFDTSNVTDMESMFSGTGENSTVFTLDLGEKFDTSNVTSMRGMFLQSGYSSTIFTLDLGEKFDTSNVTDMELMFFSVGYANDSLILDLSTFTFDNVTNYTSMIDTKATTTIYVKDTAAQTWILDKGFTNLSTTNVLVKS